MMINKRLLALAPESHKHIRNHVFLQLASLTANIAFMFALSLLLWKQSPYNGMRTLPISAVLPLSIFCLLMLALRYGLARWAGRQAFMASRSVKSCLREQIYRKLLRLGKGYREKISTAEVVQASIEGVEQLEVYFGAYLPQLFYAFIAPFALFAIIAPISPASAIGLFVCVPLIPISIILVQKWAKKLLAKYWSQYVRLGDGFLENLQGLTTLKIYQSDGWKHHEMNKEAEQFRKITMKVLSMQLNSITMMDWLAYGGAGLGMALALAELAAGRIQPSGCFLIILLSADFFLPLRLLGSLFHVAMNGMAASGKIFHLLDLPEETPGEEDIQGGDLLLEDLCFSYDGHRQALRHIHLLIPPRGFYAIVGESGSGKSTIAGILSGKNRAYQGRAGLGGTDLRQLRPEALRRHITCLDMDSYLFRGTVEENLRMAKPQAAEAELWAALEQVRLADFLRQEQGLDTPLADRASNFSGGQRQRLAMARALLHGGSLLVLDEATSNIDVESENDILQLLYKLSKEKCVLLISHRLANSMDADRIFVLDKGSLVQEGSHQDLLASGGLYRQLWQAQMDLEQYRGGIHGKTS